MKNKKQSISLTYALLFAALLFFVSCDKKSEKEKEEELQNTNFRQEMRDFVIGISEYSKTMHPGFLVIPQNGSELIFVDYEKSDSLQTAYLDAIDGIGQEDLNYGYENDNKPTPTEEKNYLKPILNTAKQNGKTILVTDYCSSLSFMDDSYNVNRTAGYVSFAANQRGLDNIPDYPSKPFFEQALDIDTLSEIKNFLYLIDCHAYASKEQFINAVAATNYDLLIIDLYFNDSTAFTQADLASMRTKANNGDRLIVCYMSIGEAENYRYYWQKTWDTEKPSWMVAENPDWAGNFEVKYWNQAWQDIIYGNENSYLKKILDAGFDGVYLDIIDGYEYFEQL